MARRGWREGIAWRGAVALHVPSTERLLTTVGEASQEREHGPLAPSELKSQILPPRSRSLHHRERCGGPYEKHEAHWTTLEGPTPVQECTRPLVVDLDGTLIASDLLIETAF